jgi:hypothetical protein
MNNTHQCATAVNECKREKTDDYKCGFSQTETIPDTYVNVITNRIIYWCQLECDLKILLYNLQMIMDWDLHVNVEYSGSAYCTLYLYEYCYKGAARREQIDLESEQAHNSCDEIKLFIHGRIMCSMSVLWHLYEYQDYPASGPPVFAFKVQTGAQLKDSRTELQVYYNCPKEVCHLKYVEFLQHYNTSTELSMFYAYKHNSENNFKDPVQFFKMYMDFPDRVGIQYMYVPVRQVKRCICLEML